MTDYVRRNATREALELTDKVIANDQSFRKILDGLWQQAFNKNFSNESIQKIRSAYLSKAKTVLPAVIQRTRNEALRGLKTSSSSQNNTGNKKILGSGKPSTQNSGKKADLDSKGIPKNMSTLDYLMSD
jgi:hypothetical protein